MNDILIGTESTEDELVRRLQGIYRCPVCHRDFKNSDEMQRAIVLQSGCHYVPDDRAGFIIIMCEL